MADTTGYAEAKQRFEKAKDAWEKAPATLSNQERQKLLKEYGVARRDTAERTPMGALGAGMLRTAGDVVTGIPDLAIEAGNWAARKIGGEGVGQLPTLGGLFRQATGQAEGPKAPELADYYNAPGYAAAAYSVSSLAKKGWKAFKDSRLTKKADELLGDLNPTERNMFQQWMVKGQGSSSPEVAAMIEKVRQNPKYAELFTAMEGAAAKEALKGIRPTGGSQTAEEAAAGIARSVQNKLDGVKKARQEAGNDSFEKAFKLAGDAPFVSTDNTLATINKLKGQYPDNAGVQAYLDNLASKIPPRTDSITNTVVPEKLTVQRLQGFLHEFGKKAEGSDSVVTGLGLDDMRRVNSALFSGLRTDLSDTLKTATNLNEKKAVGSLIQAREQFRKASEEYDNLIAQGVPKWLQSKSINEVSLEDLTKAYKDTNPSQRQVFRDWVGENRAESLKAIDKAVFDDFLAGSYKKLPDGTIGYDLGSIADTWNTLKKTDPNKAGQLADALGMNANEFSRRMKDASVFTRKIQVGGLKTEGVPIAGDASRAITAAVGASSAGYQGAKLADLGLEAVNEIFKKRGLTEEQLMKVLLTGEGKQFLQNAAISPQSAKTLQSLMTVENASLPGTVPALSAAAAPAAVVETPLAPTADIFELPPEFQPAVAMPEQSFTDNTQWELPPE
jgi:hypothetical protein